MKRVPRSGEVGKAIRMVRRELKATFKATNVLAGKRIARGDYATAEALAEKGRAIKQFEGEVQELEVRWKGLRVISNSAARGAITPLWQYYQPLLQILVKAGGECRRDELEAHVERTMAKSLLTGDTATLSGGRKRWQVMIQRARKPLTVEGWIERRAGTWRITKKGREVAERPGITEMQMLTRTASL